MANTRRISWYRVTATPVGSVANVFIESSVAAPIRGLIRRVRADITAGTGTPTIALEVREISGATGASLNVPLAYALGTDPLDSEEEIYYEIPEGADPLSRMGTLYFAVTTNHATDDHVIAVQFDIEPMG